MYSTDFWTLWEKARVACFKRTASKHVYYLGWNRSPAQVGCMRQVLGAGALGRPRVIGSRGRWEGGLGWGIHVNPWLIHVNVWQNPLQCCKVISLQLIKMEKKKTGHGTTDCFQIRKGVRQGCILSPCLFNLYAEYIMRNTGLEDVQAQIKIAGRNVNNLR